MGIQTLCRLPPEGLHPLLGTLGTHVFLLSPSQAGVEESPSGCCFHGSRCGCLDAAGWTRSAQSGRWRGGKELGCGGVLLLEPTGLGASLHEGTFSTFHATVDYEVASGIGQILPDPGHEEGRGCSFTSGMASPSPWPNTLQEEGAGTDGSPSYHVILVPMTPPQDSAFSPPRKCGVMAQIGGSISSKLAFVAPFHEPGGNDVWARGLGKKVRLSPRQTSAVSGDIFGRHHRERDTCSGA